MATGGTNKTSRADRTGSGRPSSTSSSRRSPQISLKESSLCRPSERLNPKTIDPVSGALFLIIIYAIKNQIKTNICTINVYTYLQFKDNVGKQSTFAAVYSNGGVPCR